MNINIRQVVMEQVGWQLLEILFSHMQNLQIREATTHESNVYSCQWATGCDSVTPTHLVRYFLSDQLSSGEQVFISLYVCINHVLPFQTILNCEVQSAN